MRRQLQIVCGDVGDGRDILVRVRSQCLTGDVLRSTRCDCGAQLDKAMHRIATEGPRSFTLLEPRRTRDWLGEQDSRLRPAG
jgi:GTP cyclohydrolase II